jgi:hypothetical protein
MRRVIETCFWKSRWWTSQESRRSEVEGHLLEGLSAFAAEQASIERRRGFQLTNRWFAARERAKLVLKSKLGAVEDLTPLPALEVDLDEADEDEVAEGLLYAEDEDDE